MTVRSLCACGGVLLLAAIWLLPLEDAAPRFPLHMVRHRVLVALAAPLLVLGLPALGRWFPISPLIGAGPELLLIWAGHMPAAHGLAYRLPMSFALEQASFLLAGRFVWAGCLARRGDGGCRAGAGRVSRCVAGSLQHLGTERTLGDHELGSAHQL